MRVSGAFDDIRSEEMSTKLLMRRHRSGWALLVLLLSSILVSTPCTCELISNLAVINHRFYPFSFSSSNNETKQMSLCRIPPFQEVVGEVSSASTCSVQSTLNLQSPELHELAIQYAPVLLFHPLEKYTLSAVNATFDSPSSGKIYQLSDGVYLQTDETLNLTRLLNVTRDIETSFNAHEYFFAHDLTEEYVNGAGYYDAFLDDESGNNNTGHRLSRAPIYYNVIASANSTWTFNYFLYYAFRGHSNMITVPSSNGNGKLNYTAFQLGPFGMHEGNWEHISVKGALFC